jgi:prepilin-type processing-associated H-X9-DG protein
MQCTNNLKQLSLSLHNYHDKYDSFVAGSGWISLNTSTGIRWTGTATHMWMYSGFIQLLPYVEQTARYDAIHATIVYSGSEPFAWRDAMLNGGASNSTAADLPYPIRGQNTALTCPSDNTNDIGRTEGTKTSYVMCLGDAIGRDDPGRATTESSANILNRRGMFGHRNWQSMASVTDGTSNTIAFSEAVAGRGGNTVKGRLYFDATVTASLTTDPLTVCSVSNVTSTADKRVYKANTCNYDRGGQPFDARCFHGFFNTVNSPNGPSCFSTNGDGDTIYGVYTASSVHSGGVNAGMCDGSVRFISETISNKTSGIVTPAQKTSGASDFGVWGALGTVDGGESATP